RTDPSAKAALKPLGQNPPSSGKGPSGTKGISSGLVQGMSRLDSTTRIVFEVPSEISAIAGWFARALFRAEFCLLSARIIFSPLRAAAGCGSSAVPGPLKTKYDAFVRLDRSPPYSGQR